MVARLRSTSFCFPAMVAIAVVCGLNSPPVFAKTISDTFDSQAGIDTVNSTLIVNTALGTLHPPLRIEGIERNPGDPLENPLIEVGDGRHGDFVLQNYASFSQGGDVSGQLIRLDLSVYPELLVRSFVLEAGWTLLPVGERPLVIRSLSTISVKGIILCSGANGVAGTAAMTSVASGGEGRCGGASGGAGGGSMLSIPTAGSNPVNSASSGVTGGAISSGASDCLNAGAADTGKCGGGGGAFTEGGTTGLPAATSGGSNPDRSFTFRAGGAGGAGGLATSGTGSGGGGGGGGGFIDLVAVSGIEVEGSVLARGGVGGSSDSLGAGGGGGGGTIMMASGGDIQFRAGSVVSAEGAQGGTTSSGGVTGGRGWIGRTFVVGLAATGPECLSLGVPEIPDRHVSSVGCVRYRTGSFVARSFVTDTFNSNPELKTVTLTSTLTGGSTLVTDVATSRDNFTGHDSGFLAWTGLSRVLDRYVRFQLTLNNLDSVNGARVDRIQLDYDPGVQTQFEFRSGCGTVGVLGAGSGRGGSGLGVTALLLLIPLVMIFLLRRRRVFLTYINPRRQFPG
ncbi:MAG: hypothetical protein K2X47_12695 [Bdellovibrionales bacterium]|nr:hypothetical protein [Bdellovibrionales bacterium]